MGTDETLNDFYSFSGHVLDWNWKFLGWRDLVSVMDSAHTDMHTYGPNGNIPDDVWSLRRFAVVERTPRKSRQPIWRCHHVLGCRELDAMDGVGLRSSRQAVASARLRVELERGPHSPGAISIATRM